ncbi:hypothetical protein BECAL_03367 [Bellilinea caldifistulae]|uniref:Uncharacterized protein n=1 Tax=Bellilinea caldifistulae TaxID=360411 RepID=A0A0P6Y4B8_9CHLR|nr:DUF4173 domain-containing protein [Bellilinea caldifistulae]KPL76455.1 hypothetical protein AC812_07390 [Bellilinea caldifistulae]GAP12164.1 hypothetical protein BECAL_03367 [Bellilinea caldifistulae]
MMPKSYNAFWITALLIAAGVDFLFWGKPVGVSFPIWTLLAISGALFLNFRHGSHPARANIVLGGIILALASLTFLRAEPLTAALGLLLALAALMLWAVTLPNGHWLYYTLWDTLRAVTILVFAALTRSFTLLTSRDDPPEKQQASPLSRQGWAVLRGILLALPVVGLLALLLASADLVFAQRLHLALDALRLEKLPETLFRLFYIGVLTFIFCGVLLHAVFPAHEVKPSPKESRFLSPFLGWTESSILLGSVNALFLFFVILQFRYLFGGQANIHEAGFTYAEYARRGFGELVWVAIITLSLILTLHTISRRNTTTRQRVFVALNVLLIALVLVILASAYQRLILYEQAYGFTRLRTYTYLFIPWLGLLLLTVSGLILSNQMRRMGFALIFFALGFGLLLGIWNVDGWVARQNIQRALNGQELDGDYLQTLSADAVPDLIRLAQQNQLPASARTEILIGLACRAGQPSPDNLPWQSFNLSQHRAASLLAANAGLWQDYIVQQDRNGMYVLHNGQRRYCGYAERFD